MKSLTPFGVQSSERKVSNLRELMIVQHRPHEVFSKALHSPAGLLGYRRGRGYGMQLRELDDTRAVC